MRADQEKEYRELIKMAIQKKYDVQVISSNKHNLPQLDYEIEMEVARTKSAVAWNVVKHFEQKELGLSS